MKQLWETALLAAIATVVMGLMGMYLLKAKPVSPHLKWDIAEIAIHGKEELCIGSCHLYGDSLILGIISPTENVYFKSKGTFKNDTLWFDEESFFDKYSLTLKVGEEILRFQER